MIRPLNFNYIYALYQLNLDNHLGENVFGAKRKGNLGIDIKFETALDKNITIIVYGKSPNMMKIDGDREIKV